MRIDMRAREPQKRPNASPIRNFHHILITHKNESRCTKMQVRRRDTFKAFGVSSRLNGVDPASSIIEIVK